MSAWIPTSLAVAIAALTVGAAVSAESCAPRGSSHCINNGLSVDLNSVPDITKKIAGEEPITQRQRTLAVEPAGSTPYSGPIVGVTSGKHVPTVGYSWSLE